MMNEYKNYNKSRRFQFNYDYSIVSISAGWLSIGLCCECFDPAMGHHQRAGNRLGHPHKKGLGHCVHHASCFTLREILVALDSDHGSSAKDRASSRRDKLSGSSPVSL